LDFPQQSIVQFMMEAYARIWHLWVPLVVALVGLGWFQRRLWSGRLLLMTVGLLSATVCWIVEKELTRERVVNAAWDARRVTLKEPLVMDGLRLPVGTVIRWSEEYPGHVITAELIGSQEVAPGAILTGEIDQFYPNWWRGTLAKDSVVRGWHCRAGEIDISDGGKLRWCVTAKVEPRIAGEVPAGTAIRFDSDDDDGASLHLIGGGMTLLPWNFAIPAGEWMSLYAAGEVASAPGPLNIRGAILGDGAIWQYGYVTPEAYPWARTPGPFTGWTGKLTSSLMCDAGIVLEPGMRVTIPINGNLVVTERSEYDHGKIEHIFESYHCMVRNS